MLIVTWSWQNYTYSQAEAVHEKWEISELWGTGSGRTRSKASPKSAVCVQQQRRSRQKNDRLEIARSQTYAFLCVTQFVHIHSSRTRQAGFLYEQFVHSKWTRVRVKVPICIYCWQQILTDKPQQNDKSGATDSAAQHDRPSHIRCKNCGRNSSAQIFTA